MKLRTHLANYSGLIIFRAHKSIHIDMFSFSLQERLSDVLRELLEELKEKLLGPDPELKPVPVRNED